MRDMNPLLIELVRERGAGGPPEGGDPRLARATKLQPLASSATGADPPPPAPQTSGQQRHSFKSLACATLPGLQRH